MIEAGVGALDVAIAIVLEVFGVFRKLRADEKTDAKLVYKTSVPLERRPDLRGLVRVRA